MKYAFTRNCFENYEKMQFEGTGKYEVPSIAPTHIEKEEIDLIRFDFARKLDEKQAEGKGVHFFIDDYRFIGVWREPDSYVDFLKRFDFVTTPDFSVYIDFPFSLQVLAHYRRQWLGRYWQEKGITIIPDVSWSDARSWEYCFDGIPKNSTVAVSSAGMLGNNFNKKIMLDGWKKMMEVINPKKIILYGEKIAGMDGNIVQIKPYKELWVKK